MSIGKNIAFYRKEKALTQEQLGQRLEVSNQAVSKWENEMTLPDVMLIPKIARELNISIQKLYEDGEPHNENQIKSADAFPRAVFERVFKTFYDNSGIRVTKESDEIEYQAWHDYVNNGDSMSCISNTCGATVLSKEFAFTDCVFKDKQDYFTSQPLALELETLSQKAVRIVIDFAYNESFKRDKEHITLFTLKEIMDASGLSEEEVTGALFSLASLKIAESVLDEDEAFWSFSTIRLLYVLEIFRFAHMLTYDMSWLVLRESSIINDIAFIQ